MVDAISEIGEKLDGTLTTRWFEIALWQYILALAFVVVALFARRGAAFLLKRYIQPAFSRSTSEYPAKFVEAIGRPLTALITIFGLYLAVQTLLIGSESRATPPIVTSETVSDIFHVAVGVVVIWTVMRLVDILAYYIEERVKASELPLDDQVIPLVRKGLKILVVLLGGLSLVHQLGYSVTSILGGLGIGGLAIALAAQDTLSNLFGSIIVFTDKPFKVGDWIMIGNVEGYVERVGFRSTRIRTFARTLVTLPNKVIANSHIENFTAMPIRRVRAELRVSYEATADQMETLVKRIEQLIVDHPGVDKGFYMVKFTDMAESSMNILLYYFTVSTKWAEHLQVRQEINLGIMRIMEEMGVSIALPSHTVYIASEGQRVLGSRKAMLIEHDDSGENDPLRPGET